MKTRLIFTPTDVNNLGTITYSSPKVFEKSVGFKALAVRSHQELFDFFWNTTNMSFVSRGIIMSHYNA